MHQGRRQLHPLLVAMRQGLDLAGGAVGHVQALQPLFGGSGSAAPVHAVQPSQVLELVCHQHVGVQAPLLWHVTEAAALGGPDRRPIPPHRPGVEVGEPEDGPHRRGFAGAVRTKEPHDLSGGDRKAQVVEGGHRAEPPAQAVELQEVGHERVF
jgi:hypothetical protein